MSTATDRATAVQLHVVIADGINIDYFLPGAVVFLRPQRADVAAVRHNGVLVPVASVTDVDNGVPFGLVNRLQQTAPQPLAAFGIATLLVNVAGEAEALVRDPGPDVAEVSVASDASGKTYRLGRRVGSWLFAGPEIAASSRAVAPDAAALSRRTADPNIGDACAIVAMHPCLAAGRPLA